MVIGEKKAAAPAPVSAAESPNGSAAAWKNFGRIRQMR
jgi:hypothetical protein